MYHSKSKRVFVDFQWYQQNRNDFYLIFKSINKIEAILFLIFKCVMKIEAIFLILNCDPEIETVFGLILDDFAPISFRFIFYFFSFFSYFISISMFSRNPIVISI